MVFQQDPSNRKTFSDSDSDFEDGDNKKEMTELDLIDKSKLENLVQEAYTNFTDQFNHMSIKQKTNYFVSEVIIKLNADNKHSAHEHMPLPDK